MCGSTKSDEVIASKGTEARRHAGTKGSRALMCLASLVIGALLAFVDVSMAAPADLKLWYNNPPRNGPRRFLSANGRPRGHGLGGIAEERIPAQ